MAQHAPLAPPPHHGGHEPYPSPPHHVLAASHHPMPNASSPSHQPQHQHQQHSPQHALPPLGGPEYYNPPSSNSFYTHRNPSLHSNSHLPQHPPPPHSNVSPGPPQMPSAGPSTFPSPSAPSSSMEWPPSGSSSQDRRQSVQHGSGHRSQHPTPDPNRRASEIHMQQQGVRTSDSFLARATNEHLVMHDRPMARQPSDMGPPQEEDDGRVGVEDPYTERSYTELKVLGDGSFGTVWLCDWHSPVKPGVLLSAMQCGAGARPEWAGKRLVALKRMKRTWEGGWRQARQLGELVSLRNIPPHPAVIPLYDAFISPRSRELYFVFECMEGNLYQLTKSRKGRPLAAGLIASCFQQMVSGLQHIHHHGYFHRDMKPENLLVTTTGLCDYLSTSAVNEINARRASGETDAQLSPNDTRIEKDVQVIIKLADFGLARGINSKPPYTEYVSTRWYRAPEVLLRARDYGAPVDMWALGTILAEMINLKPLFPGVSEIDQVYRICEVLGDPNPEYGPDENGVITGGGRWNTGIKLAKKVGFSFPKRKPVQLRGLFPPDTPRSLVDCVANLLRYNPRFRMTSEQCLGHSYFREVMPHLQRMPPLPCIPFFNGQPSPGQTPRTQQPPTEVNLNIPSRAVPPSHSHQEPHGAFANGDIRTLPPPESATDTPVHEILTPNGHPQVSYFGRHPMQRQDSDHQRPPGASASALVRQLRELDLPTDDLASYGARRWSEAELLASRQQMSQQRYEGSVHGSIPDNISNRSYSNLPNMSAASLERQMPHQQHSHQQSPSPHVMAYIQQQAAYQQQMQQPQMSQSTPNLTPTATASEGSLRPQAQSTMTLPLLPSASSEMLPPQSTSKLGPPPPAAAPGGKKKKWGLSSVFGGNAGKSSITLPSVDEHGGSTTSLKRTQSGHYADERATPPTGDMDPKQAKKEAERQARELAKAKREAAERAQKERARAVLSKRQQLMGTRGTSEIEYTSVINTDSRIVNGLPKQPPSSRPVAGYQSSGYPASHGSTSLQSLGSVRSGQSPYLGVEDTLSRHKARKHSEEDDHSSIGRASGKSRSLLSVAESDPGQRRSIHSLWPDPMLQAARRPPSNTYAQSNMSHSAASFESQLASQLQRQATVQQSASESSLSLGRTALSNRASVSGPALHEQSPYGRHDPSGGPYGHPTYSTVPPSLSTRSSRAQLPSIDDLPEMPNDINPMFRVPSREAHSGVGNNTNGLPPFAAIANMANAHHPSHHQGPQ